MNRSSRACDHCYAESPEQYDTMPTICEHNTWTEAEPGDTPGELVPGEDDSAAVKPIRLFDGLAEQLAAEPQHCGVAMVHNTGTRKRECTAAYYELVDAGAVNSSTPVEMLTADDVSPQLVEVLAHWRASRTPDDSDA